MHDRALRAPRRYEATLDRAGWALAAGSGIVGVLAGLLLAIGGRQDFATLAVGAMVGALFGGIAITAVAAPLWLVLHVAGMRRARHAAGVGAFTAMAIFVGAQTYGFGLAEMPALDSRTWMFRWASAVASSALVAVVAALIGIVMWRIAYRRQV
ncbi:hypothetical protein ACG3SL_15970 [Sphingomonas sp. CJ20]